MPGEDFGFGRLVQEDAGELGLFGEFTGVLEDVVGLPVFAGGQAVEGVVDFGWEGKGGDKG
jgi:hypothetical protein